MVDGSDHQPNTPFWGRLAYLLAILFLQKFILRSGFPQ
jgi:hypothetical protein